ncbi:MAG: adenosylcobalamin-dependent ribonucleoside-diphosphate reductase, partial [Phycisphaerales bacterium]|nr:adenosylcobalamin-dependent ribonucleoside-diphosphate reductase [Phycisphaerales bacterium]
MKITRRFTTAGHDVYNTVEWTLRTSKITNADGSTVFEMKDAEVPKSWSQLATDIMVSKYFRKAGVPQAQVNKSTSQQVKSNEPRTTNHEPHTGPEKSVRQVVHRLAGCWKHWGQEHGYFDSAEDAQAFYDEIAYMMLHQMAAPNSPQWFNTGLNWAYGISGPPQGHFIADPETGAVRLAADAYTHPQPHACFIQSVKDDLVGGGGIMDLWTREARLFKYGSGTGTNFSSLRGEGEPLSGGGTSSGLMSWLRIGDRAAGAIKSGGTTRRAAKMVCLDADHPDIEAFVNWKVREELKVAALVEGMKHLPKDQKELADSLSLKLTYDFNGEAYYTVSGQNSNNSVRLTDDFFRAVENDGDWHLRRRTDGAISKTLKARDLWNQICRAAWRCADPGVQYDTTINDWHTCPNSGRINASNPCSEYMFLDDTACNLASINLMEFFDADRRRFDLEGYEHAINLWTIVLEISVLMASFPSEEIARQSFRFRTLGLGYANLGAMLMQAGIPYDSEDARAICGALSAILTGRSYAMSAQMAGQLTPFPGYSKNREAMMRVIRNHRRAAYGVPRDSDAYEGLSIKPVPIDHERFKTGSMNLENASDVFERATKAWDDAMELGQRYGYRNAQVTVIAPTGTIGLLMDCDTTGVEPDFALVKFKKLAGGGYFKIANASLRPALKSLGYSPRQIDDIVTYVMGTLSIDTPLPASQQSGSKTFRDYLQSRGYHSNELVEVENTLPTVFELSFAFTAWSMPERVLKSFGIDPEKAKKDSTFNGLKALGLTTRQIDELNRIVCGTQCIEGAPHIKPEHLAVFDCANKCGATGTRFIAPQGHIRMMAAAQPFISGAISKTINLPEEASVSAIGAAYHLSWELGLKANALYRDNSKLSQPLSTKSDVESDDQTGEDINAEEVEAVLGEALTEAAAAERAGTSTSSTFSDPPTSVTPGNLDPARRTDQPVISRMLASNNGDEHPAPHDHPAYIERIVERIIERPMRRRLPDTRRSITHHFNVAGHEGYLTVGQYDDGSPGELFITMSKEGSTIGGLMDSLGTAISVALQYGVPIESLVNKFAHQRFEPMGMTTNADVPIAKSLVDYIFRWMGMEFIPGYRQANAPPRTQGVKTGTQTPPPSTGIRSEAVQEGARWLEKDSNLGSGPGLASPKSSVIGATGTSGLNRPSSAAVQRLSEIDGRAKIDGPSSSMRATTSMAVAGGNGRVPGAGIPGAIPGVGIPGVGIPG